MLNQQEKKKSPLRKTLHTFSLQCCTGKMTEGWIQMYQERGRGADIMHASLAWTQPEHLLRATKKSKQERTTRRKGERTEYWSFFLPCYRRSLTCLSPTYTLGQPERHPCLICRRCSFKRQRHAALQVQGKYQSKRVYLHPFVEYVTTPAKRAAVTFRIVLSVLA